MGSFDLNLAGAMDYVDNGAGGQHLEIDITYDDSETDPLDQNTDGSIKSCINSLLFRLSNSWDLPADQIATTFIRDFNADTSRRSYKFYI